MYSSFCSAANSLSQLYTHATNHQKISFQAGERHALEKVYQWILRQHEEDSRVTITDIISRIQNEIDYGGEDAATSPRLHHPQQCLPTAMHFPNSGNGVRNHDDSSGSNPPGSNDSSMDMHSDSPTHESY
ncbi:uncharacterized protein M6B38_418650 [Iris pallida]|uniref:Holocarboxylase synthetase n=1 Tax=Iris pallida TaxID=29817 RepID=A0AAX6FHK6_IRIPA|nr:uncharacterized protein M6B38_418650 [Iris pallida]